jgi:uncharacterized protein
MTYPELNSHYKKSFSKIPPPYYSFKSYLIENYGAPYYRVPIDLALSCPHKKSKIDGCIFCAEDGARAVHLSKHLNLKQQVADGIKYVENRYNANGNYIAYFQSYTNTNSDVNTLKKLYDEVLNAAKFKIVIISTRPDCLSNDIVTLLSVLSNKYNLWVELGVQSANDKTLEKINRGHSFSETENAVVKLNSIGVKTVAHVIVGLPDETHEDYCNTIDEINKLPFSAVKIHNLLLLKNSPLAKLYNKSNIPKQTGEILIPEIGTINLMNEYEYAGTVIDLIRRIPENRPLLRINADALEKNIIGPRWNLSKGQFLELVKSTMLENNYSQGDLVQRIDKSEKRKVKNNYELGISNYKKEKDYNNELKVGMAVPSRPGENFVFDKNKDHDKDKELKFQLNPLTSLKIKTDDNSFTFYSPKYKENYHSIAGAASEAEYKFVIPVKLEEKLAASCHLKLLDIGFGLGYNAITAVKASIKLKTKLSITSLEMDYNTLNMGLSLYQEDSLEHEIISSLLKYSKWNDSNNSINLIVGDARKKIDKNRFDYYDIIFLDAFSPQKNPELWTYDFINILYNLLTLNGVLVTYSSAFPVRGAMLRCGFTVGETEAFGRKKGGTIASKYNNSNVGKAISEKEINIITKSTAGAPYRDPALNWTAKQIFKHKDKLTKRLKSKGIPKWYK